MITLASENATAQIDSLLEKYPELAVTETSSSQIRLRGSIHVYRHAAGFTVNHDYNIELLIPIGSDQLPSVYETGNNMDVKYQHRYRDGKLCLETDTAIRLRFYDGIVLLEWMDEFVEPVVQEKKKGMRGFLAEYANSELAMKEKGAWQQAVVDKYGNL